MGAADAADDSVRLSRLAPGVARVPISQGEPVRENPRYELIATSLDKRAMRDHSGRRRQSFGCNLGAALETRAQRGYNANEAWKRAQGIRALGLAVLTQCEPNVSETGEC